MNFEVLILGSDPNAYYMARCCYEAYQKKPYVIGRSPLAFTTYSSILNIKYEESMWEEQGFLKVLDDFAKEHNKPILLISTNETYTEFVSKNKEKLQDRYIFNFPSLEVIKSLTNKENFYKTYQNSKLTFPTTIYYDCKKDKSFPSDLKYPLILKPANVVIYNHIKFPGKNKIYKIKNKEELENTIKLIKNNGYDDKLIIQEFIPGGDDALFDAVLYVNTKGKCEFMTFAQIGLQERTNNMVGNAAVLINGFNTTKGDVDKEVSILKEFMESINYRGFAEVDMKYDYRDNTFKVLEINARQGRSSYYVAALGKNLIETIAHDCLDSKTHEFELLKDTVLLSFVPKGIIKKYITNEDFKKMALKLWPNVVKPMDAPCDRDFKRFLMLRKRWHNYYKEYKNSYWGNGKEN